MAEPTNGWGTTDDHVCSFVDKRLVHISTDDPPANLHVVNPASNFEGTQDEFITHLKAIERLADDAAEGSHYWWVDKEDVPADRSFRNAWTYS